MNPGTPTDISGPHHKANPFPFYSHLRANSPVHRMQLRDGRTAWIIARYDDAVAAFKDPRFVKDKWSVMNPEQLRKEPWLPPMFKPLARHMLDLDGADHARLRSLVQKAFTPGLVESLRGRIQHLAADRLDAALKRGKFDFIRDYALPIPTTVIAEMLGVPVRDSKAFNRWTKAIVSSTPSTWGLLKVFPQIWSFLRYIRRLIKAKRTNPQADLLSRLVEVESQGDQLTEDELVAMAFLLLVAGHETTVNLIGNGMLALLQHPEAMTRLRQDRSLVKPAIEEMLRFTSPVETATERYTREDVTLRDQLMPRGSFVLIAIASANRDGSQFDRPDEFDVSREPNRHLSFGLGNHFCLGAYLARLEGQIAFNTLFDKLPEIHLAIPESRLTWRRGMVLRGLESLPVKIH